jgi:hypothetical protein
MACAVAGVLTAHNQVREQGQVLVKLQASLSFAAATHFALYNTVPCMLHTHIVSQVSPSSSLWPSLQSHVQASLLSLRFCYQRLACHIPDLLEITLTATTPKAVTPSGNKNYSSVLFGEAEREMLGTCAQYCRR